MASMITALASGILLGLSAGLAPGPVLALVSPALEGRGLAKQF